jgi:hypothetical protein
MDSLFLLEYLWWLIKGVLKVLEWLEDKLSHVWRRLTRRKERNGPQRPEKTPSEIDS